jgi:hypothetical protein
MIPSATNGGTSLTTSRVYENVQDVQKEIVTARVWGGLHFRNSVEQGEKPGNRVAGWDLKQAFQQATRSSNRSDPRPGVEGRRSCSSVV